MNVIVLLLKAAAKYSQSRNFIIKEKKKMVNKMNKFSWSRWIPALKNLVHSLREKYQLF